MSVLQLIVILLCAVHSIGAENNPTPVQQLVQANDAFALQLLHQLELAEKAEQIAQNREPKNVFFSPFCVSTVLAMLMAGSANETYSEMRNTTGIDASLSEPEIYTTYSRLLEHLKVNVSTPLNTLQVANSIALHTDYRLHQSYHDILSNQFDSTPFSVDFQTKGAEAIEQINNWVTNKTNGHLGKLFNEPLDTRTKMVLLNAVYFKGTWKRRFPSGETKSRPFHYAPNKTIDVPMMTNLLRRNISKLADGSILLELPYKNNQFSMFFYLPAENDQSTATTISEQFGRMPVSSRIAAMKTAFVNMTIPKFAIESSYKLKPALQALGMQLPFEEFKANFSRISNQTKLFLEQVLHKTRIEVDEEGSQ